MKPSIEEQLLGTCRVLDSVVAPALSDAFARNILDGLTGNLRMLAKALPGIAAFLRWDNAATLALLQEVQGSAAPDLASAISTAAAEAEPDAADWNALDARNQLLRELLSRAVCSDGLSELLRKAAVRHMSERASRTPLRYVAAAPAPATIPDSTS